MKFMGFTVGQAPPYVTADLEEPPGALVFDADLVIAVGETDGAQLLLKRAAFAVVADRLPAAAFFGNGEGTGGEPFPQRAVTRVVRRVGAVYGDLDLNHFGFLSRFIHTPERSSCMYNGLLRQPAPVGVKYMVGEPVAQRQVDGDADREGEEGLEANRRQFAEARGQADA